MKLLKTYSAIAVLIALLVGLTLAYGPYIALFASPVLLLLIVLVVILKVSSSTEFEATYDFFRLRGYHETHVEQRSLVHGRSDSSAIAVYGGSGGWRGTGEAEAPRHPLE